MPDFWENCIRRAEELARSEESTSHLLGFYASLLGAQKEVYESLRGQRGWLPSGSLENDLTVLKSLLPILLQTVERNGPTTLAEEAQRLSQASSDIVDELLLNYWRSASGEQFFAKSLLQPYFRWLADSGGTLADRPFDYQEHRCPFCGGMPQVSYLRIVEASSESGNRHLVCATCLSEWPFRRVVCAYCLEERPAYLGYFQTQDYEHVRVETCDTCRHYIKGVDLTRLGFAVPLVDEVASAALDVWSQQQFYTKIELNLIGL